jgi:UDP-glucose 4-epimerase
MKPAGAVKPRILITGGTGFLGKWVVKQLCEWAEVDVITRRENPPDGFVMGDLTRWNAGLDLEALGRRHYSLCLHMAGLYDLRATTEECCLHNTLATSTILKVVEALGIPNFIQTSSVAAVINSPLSYVNENDTFFDGAFPDAYSESKSQCERILKSWLGPIEKRVNLRLGVLVGDSIEGSIERIDGPYFLAHTMANKKSLISKLPFPLVVPGNPQRSLPVVPVDAAAKAIDLVARWILKPESKSMTLHLTPRRGLTHRKLYESALKNLSIKNRGVKLVEIGRRGRVAELMARALDLPKEELFYFMNFPRYEVKSTLAVLPADWCPEFEDYEKAFWRGYETFLSNS